MADRMQFKMTGWDQLQRNLLEIGPELATKGGQTAVRNAGKKIADAVRAAAPVGDGDTTRTYDTKKGSVTVDYGHLRDNIKVRKGKPRQTYTVVSIVTVGKAFWGKFLEFGTVKMAARPFFRPAFDAMRQQVIMELGKDLGKALDRLAKRNKVTLTK